MLPFIQCAYGNLKGHSNSDICLEADTILHHGIGLLNAKIHTLNRAYGFQTSLFSSDFVRTRKCRKRKIKTILWSLLCGDGIHPDIDLCQLWIRKIVLSLGFI